ncbi:serpin-Z2A-like [Chenopodium quinoa]|uniref:serpin-Z2A-like n=1 Tax=Chenopodium quinoa TaxID=63459 RepID=UPI000B792475|nr:serpin-Z2A-like [Chenopodium quinoa]
MVIILPKERTGLLKLIEKFKESPHLLTSQHLKMKNELITCLSIPRFKLSYNFIPSENMQELGLTLPFDFNGELDGLIEDNDLKVSRITQHTQVECNEKGTEVITCTYDSDEDMGFSFDSPPPPKPSIWFIADHPFMFMIKEDVSDNIFFLGAIFNPLEKDNRVISKIDPVDKENEDISDNEESDDSEGFSLFD